MPLNVQQLAAGFLATFDAGKAGATQEQVALGLAQAIHAYVSAALVTGIVVDVVDSANKPLGTGKQTQPVHLT